MEMHLFDRLAISLERLYTAVPSVLLDLYEFTWEASSLSCILGQELYKCVLLITGIIRAILRLLAYFFHFDPPTFDALREMARIHLDPDAASHQKDRLVLERIIAQLEGDNDMLLRKSEEMLVHIYSLEAHARGLEASLSQQEDTARQLLLGILACRQTAPPPVLRPQSPKLQFDVSPKLLESSQIAKDDTGVIQKQGATPQLLVQLLTFRRSNRCRAKVVTSILSANRHLKEAVRRSEAISQSLLIELLTIRKDARASCAQNGMKTRLATILVHKQQQGMQIMEAEHETTNKHLLIQTLTLRSRLSRLVLSCKSASPDPAPPISPVKLMTLSVSFQSLTTQLEALRLSEAQAHAEKDSLANSLSDVLANLQLPDPCVNIREEGPIKELVLALAFTWKMLQRKPPAMAKLEEVLTHNVNGDLNLRGTQIRALRPGIPFDSVRARAFKLGPPMNKSAIPIQDPPRHRVIYDADASIHLDSHLGRSPTQINESQPQYPPGIPLPLHLPRSPLIPPNHHHVFGPLVANTYPNPTYPSRSKIMSRGGYTIEPYNEVGFHPDGQARHELAINYLGSPRPIGSLPHSTDAALSAVQHAPPRPFSAS